MGFDLDLIKRLIHDEVEVQIALQTVRKYGNSKQAAAYMGWSETVLAQRKCKGEIPDYCFKKEGGILVWSFEGLDRWQRERPNQDKTDEAAA